MQPRKKIQNSQIFESYFEPCFKFQPDEKNFNIVYILDVIFNVFHK